MERVFRRGAAAGQLLDALLGGSDDGVVGVVVLFEARRLAVDRAVDVLLLVSEALDLGVVLAPVLADRPREIEAQQPQAIRGRRSARP